MQCESTYFFVHYFLLVTLFAVVHILHIWMLLFQVLLNILVFLQAVQAGTVAFIKELKTRKFKWVQTCMDAIYYKKLLCKTCSIKEVNFIFFTLVGHRLSNIHTLVVRWFPMVFHGISHNSLVFSCYYTYISVTELSYTLPEKICWPT